MELEISAMHVAGMASAAAKLGFDDVIPSLSGEVREAFASPYSHRWHPAAVLVDFSAAVFDKHGADGLETLSYEMTKSSFSMALRPLIFVALAIKGGSPSALFSRVGIGVGLALRGMKTTWNEAQRSLSFEYPKEIPAAIFYSWRGVIRFLFEVAKRPGSIASHQFSADQRTLIVFLNWE